MANDRGTYGHNGVSRSVSSGWGTYGTPRLGAEIYVERPRSTWKWIVGGIVVGGAVLWARHTSGQIEQLYAKAGLPRQSFTQSLRESARTLPGRTRSALRGFTRRGSEARSREERGEMIPAPPEKEGA